MTGRKPGQLRSRDARKPKVQQAAVPSIGPIIVTAMHVDRLIHSLSLSTHPLLVSENRWRREIARIWQVRHTNQRASTAALHRGALGRVSALLEQHSIRHWGDLTIPMLEELERGCRARKAEGAVDALVTRSSASLPAEYPRPMIQVQQFLKAPPNVATRATTPTEALPAATLRDVLRAAMYDVTQAEHRIRKAGWDGVSPPPAEALIRRHETTAFYVLLCMEWSQSPDVIKTLSFDPHQPTSVQDWGRGTSSGDRAVVQAPCSRTRSSSGLSGGQGMAFRVVVTQAPGCDCACALGRRWRVGVISVDMRRPRP